MSLMFADASAFNQPIGELATSSVEDMSYMFKDAEAFNQDLGEWDVTSLYLANDMFDGIALSTHHHDALLIGWEA